jgi:hypothetical protein
MLRTKCVRLLFATARLGERHEQLVRLLQSEVGMALDAVAEPDVVCVVIATQAMWPIIEKADRFLLREWQKQCAHVFFCVVTTETQDEVEIATSKTTWGGGFARGEFPFVLRLVVDRAFSPRRNAKSLEELERGIKKFVACGARRRHMAELELENQRLRGELELLKQLNNV